MKFTNIHVTAVRTVRISLQTAAFCIFPTSVDSLRCKQSRVRKQTLQPFFSLRGRWLMVKTLHLDDFTGLVAGRIVLLESDLCSLRDNSSVTCNTVTIKTTFYSVYGNVGWAARSLTHRPPTVSRTKKGSLVRITDRYSVLCCAYRKWASRVTR